MGPAAPDFSNQIHDFDPGIHPFPNGLFWVVALAPDNVDFNLGQGTASLRVSGQSMRDFGSIPNALSNGPSVSAVASYDVEWSGIAQRGTFSSTSQHFALEPFVRTSATVNWTGSSSKGNFTSTAVTKVNFAQLTHETNGVFFGG